MKKKVRKWKRCTQRCLNLNPKILKSSLIYLSVTKARRGMRNHALCLNFSKMSQRLAKTSEPSALVKRAAKAYTIKVTSSIASLRASWLKAVTLRLEMVLVAVLFTAKSLLTSKYGTLILTRVYYLWPTQVKTQMEASSSFVLEPLLI